MNNQKASIAATTTIEVGNKLRNGKITLNQARTILNLKPIQTPQANELLVKRDIER